VMVKSVAASLRYRWVILGLCWLAFAIAFMQRLSIGPLAPFLKEDLSLSGAQVGFFMSAAAFGSLLTAAPAGWLADRIGVRWLLLVGGVIGGIFIASMFTITSFTQGLILMALAGTGMGCVSPATTKAVLEWFPAKERATAMGFKQTGLNVGGIIAAATLPTMALALGWQYGFLGIGLIVMVIGIVSFILYKQPPQSISLDTSKPVTSSRTRPSVLEVFRNRDIWLLITAGLCLVAIEMAAIAHFVLYLNEALLFGVVIAGFFLAIVEGSGAFGKPISGLISDRLFHGGRKKVYILMSSITFVMCVMFAFLWQGSPLWLIVLLSLVFGFAAVGWAGLHLTLIGEFAGKELAGMASGMSTPFLAVGNIAGPPLFGYIIDSTGSYQIAWGFLAVVALLATALLFFVREERKKI
jgi:ACS family hexuronate transporter-like MFS transporter